MTDYFLQVGTRTNVFLGISRWAVRNVQSSYQLFHVPFFSSLCPFLRLSFLLWWLLVDFSSLLPVVRRGKKKMRLRKWKALTVIRTNFPAHDFHIHCLHVPHSLQTMTGQKAGFCPVYSLHLSDGIRTCMEEQRPCYCGNSTASTLTAWAFSGEDKIPSQRGRIMQSSTPQGATGVLFREMFPTWSLDFADTSCSQLFYVGGIYSFHSTDKLRRTQ